MQLKAWAFSFALVSAGKSSPARIAMIAITTNNSISVKAILQQGHAGITALHFLTACTIKPVLNAHPNHFRWLMG
jgi:hypothetical protein